MLKRPGFCSRKSLVLSLTLLTGLGVLSAAVSAAQISREIVVDPAGLQIRTQGDGVVLELEGAFNALPPGEPNLPLLSVPMMLPEGMVLDQATVVAIETQAITGNHRLLGVGVSEAGTFDLPGAVRADLQGSTSWYPQDAVVKTANGRMRGRNLATVAVSPVSWNPGSGELRLMTRFRIDVTTREAAPRRDDLVLERESQEGYRSFLPVFEKLTGTPAAFFDTPERLRPQVNSGAPFAPTFRPSIDGSAVDMVIITDTAQEPEYQRLADFRTKLGISTVVRTVDWIVANYPNGVDLQETLRLFIRDSISKWGTAWVLLGGDTDVVPIRMGFTNFYGSEEIPTDLYYTAVDGNWNEDGDGVFGEGFGGVSSPGDNVDLFPDVWVGRLTTNNVSEAQNAVDKTIDYVQSPPLGYQTELLFAGEVLFPQNWKLGDAIQFDGALLCEDVIDTTLVQHNPVKLYENYTAWPGSIAEDKATVVASVNSGFHLFNHVGHGYINTMSVGLNQGALGNSDALGFTNGNETFLLYAINCTSCAVDFNCVGESFIRNTQGGAMAVIGSTRLDFPSTGRLYQDEFFHLLFQSEENEMGKAFALAKVPFLGFAGSDNTHRWTQFTHIYLGDPALGFWLDVPGSLTVTHGPSFELGSGTYSVTVTRGGSPVESARVTLFKDNDAYAVAYTDAAGLAVVPFHPDETGSFSVGAFSKHDLPYLGNATVTAPAGAYVFAQSQGIVDDGSGLSSGNSDFRIDAGETVEVTFTLKNSGTLTETGISATLSTGDPYLTITDGSSAFPSIAAGATAAGSDPFVLSVSRSAPDRVEAKCTLSINGAGGTYDEEVILYIHAPRFEYRMQALRDSIGNGNDDNIITANEDFAIVPHIRNIGLGLARSVELRLRSTDPAVTITDSVSVLGDILADQIVVPGGDGFAVQLSDVLTEHEMTVVALDAYGEVFSTTNDVIIPGTVQNVIGFGGATSIALRWDPVSDSDLWGYNVYRAPTDTGPFVRINQWTTDRTAYFVDDGLPALTRFYYTIASIDSSGNEGPSSVLISATTSLPVHEGWPVEVLTPTTGGVTLADIDGNGTQEIIGAAEEIYVITPEGRDFFDGDEDVRTLGPLTNTGGVLFWNTPAVADVDGDGVAELSAIAWNDERIYLVDHEGVDLPGWPKDINPLGVGELNPLGSVCFGDIDADGDLEIFCTAARIMFAWHHDGTEIVDGDANPATDGVFLITASNFSYGTPSIANIDEEPYREIIFGMRDGNLYVYNHDATPYPGFPFATGGNITSSPAIGDIDDDGNLEIVFGSSDIKLYAIRNDLSSASGFPAGILLNSDVDSSPALGDIANDGYLDVAIGTSNGQLKVFSGLTGIELPGFPVDIDDPLGNPVEIRSSPTVADIDNDGTLDIVIGDQLGRVHCFDNTGNYLPGFPIQTGNLIENAAAIGDPDQDGLTEIIVEGFDQKIYVWDTPWAYNPALAVWPMFKANARNSGVYGEPDPAVTSVPTTPGGKQATLLQNFPNPFHLATQIRYRVPEGKAFQGVELRVYDINGRALRTLIHGQQPPGFHEINWDGTDDRGRPVASGIYAYRLQVAGETHTRKLMLIK